MLTALLMIPMATASDDILFVGNSYTISNNLPATIAAVYEAAGSSATTAKVASGGLTLASHAERAADEGSAWHTKLVTEAADREWVVLQDQSQVPGFPHTESMWIASRDGAQYLNGLVADAGAETVFFLTWGYRDGDSMNEWMYPDFTAMLGRISDGYAAYAAACTTEERTAWVAPVGHAFAVIHDDILSGGEEPTTAGSLFHRLYSSDGSHPSALGTQLAAYVLYASLTGETPIGLPAPSGIEADVATALQEAAASAVFSTTDDFEFPWETSGETADDPEDDTATEPEEGGEDSGDDGGLEGGDSGDTEDHADGNDDDGDAGTAGPEGSASDEVTASPSTDDTKGGCSALGQRSGHSRFTPWWAATLLVGARRRRR